MGFLPHKWENMKSRKTETIFCGKMGAFSRVSREVSEKSILFRNISQKSNLNCYKSKCRRQPDGRSGSAECP